MNQERHNFFTCSSHNKPECNWYLCKTHCIFNEACTNVHILIGKVAIFIYFYSHLWMKASSSLGFVESLSEAQEIRNWNRSRTWVRWSGCTIEAPYKHSSQECHRLMITNSVRIPEGGLFLKKLMLPDACLDAIKDVSPKFIWSSWFLMMKHLCSTSNAVCLAFPNPAVILGNS